MKKYQLTSVNSPSIDFEIGDQKISSTVIKSLKRNPNFDQPLFFFDVVCNLFHLCVLNEYAFDIHSSFGYFHSYFQKKKYTRLLYGLKFEITEHLVDPQSLVPTW